MNKMKEKVAGTRLINQKAIIHNGSSAMKNLYVILLTSLAGSSFLFGSFASCLTV